MHLLVDTLSMALSQSCTFSLRVLYSHFLQFQGNADKSDTFC